MRRSMLMLTLALTMLAPGFAGADPVPGVSEPVLRPDTKWIKTDWGYRHSALDLNPAPPQGEQADYAWPTLMETEGYSGAGTPNAYLRMDDGELMALNITFGRGPRKDYAYVKASVRGTECSGGHYNLYDRRHAWDGHHIIEWIAAQRWSNERVGLHGSSLSGQTAYWIATTKPPHLAALSSNALHSDIYRDIFMVGGVQNNLFPVAWTYGQGVSGPHRLPLSAMESGTLVNDEICAWNNSASKYSIGDLPQPENEPAFAAIRSVDDDWYASHAAITYADSIKIPYYQQVNWQDEQVGPRAVVLFNHINPRPRLITDRDGRARVVEPKTFSLSSGDHGWGRFHDRDLWDFLDIWLLDRQDVNGLYEYKVRNYFETRDDNWAQGFTAVKSGDTWPFEGTRYPKLFLRADGVASADAPATDEPGDTYVSGAARQNWFWYTRDQKPGSDATTARGYPDGVTYTTTALDADAVVNGPVMMELWAQLAGTDADFFVSIEDVYPDGRVSHIQRGLLKASHRAVDPLRSYYDTVDGERIMVQPFHPHTNPQPVVPNEPTKFAVEILPMGHVFRAGHKIMIQIHTPPAVDGLWGYTPTHHQPAAVTVLHDRAHPSWLQLPIVRLDATQPPEALLVASDGCTVPGGFPCTQPSALNR